MQPNTGHNPSELQGLRTGVFCAALGGEALDNGYFRFDKDMTGYLGFSCFGFVIPARIAFGLNLQGPSIHLSSACSSSLTAIEVAVNNILVGNIDAAIVTGSNALMNPRAHLEFMAYDALAKDGHCKTFDESGKRIIQEWGTGNSSKHRCTDTLK